MVFMILLGIIDLVAAAMIYWGDVPGPDILKSAVVLILAVKGLLSSLDAIRFLGG